MIGDLATRLNQFLWAPRNSRYFASRVWMVAFGLGRVYSAVESANNAWRVQYQVVGNHESLIVHDMLIGFRYHSSGISSPMQTHCLCRLDL